MKLLASTTRATLLLLLAVTPLVAQGVAGPQRSAAQIGIRSALSPSAKAHVSLAHRKIRNPGWIIGAVAGGALGAWGGYLMATCHQEGCGGSKSRNMPILGLIGAAVGSLIGGVVGSK